MLIINKKEDIIIIIIIIPFDKIGDENWGDELKEPISENDIKALENRLGATLPENLKIFYQTFGMTGIGEQLQDFDGIDRIKNIWADAPQYAPDFTEGDKLSLPNLIS
ncbi:SMI1/KNR4 family protein [Sphingobacterium daejeonense]|uniref:SMI1/KNR4 family protein n=1 Tax=Sphingobacterium daejeonense TaxID=371142 RepID=UPI003D3167F9